MTEVDGLVYLLNQVGVALARANARIVELEQALLETQSHREQDSE